MNPMVENMSGKIVGFAMAEDMTSQDISDTRPLQFLNNKSVPCGTAEPTPVGISWIHHGTWIELNTLNYWTLYEGHTKPHLQSINLNYCR